MATKARQQYFADEDSLQKIRREFSIADDIQQKIDSIEEGAQVNVIETVKVNGTSLIPDANKAVNVEVPEVIDNLYTIDSDNALSAKQGKLLYDYIQNIASRGRFLSNWNSATGLPMTNPSESPYPYKSGDYFVVSNVAGLGGTNYRPDGSSYIIGQASTVVETESVDVSDFYFYDGTNWLLLKNSSRSGVVDSALSTTSTNPVENRVITNALNGKQEILIAGNNIQIAADGKTISATDTTYSAGINISIDANNQISAIDTTYTAGTNVQISAQNVISATDTKYIAGTGISIDANNVISNTQTSAEWGNITGNIVDQIDLQEAISSATAGAVSDTAYAASWDGVTGIAPSKNAMYDKLNAMDTTIAGKQATISDLATIRSGASAGATAVQPGDLATIATSGKLEDASGDSDDIIEGSTNLFLTSAERTKLGNTSGTNSGDETKTSIQTKLGAASSSNSGYLTSTDWDTFNNKVEFSATNGGIKIFDMPTVNASMDSILQWLIGGGEIALREITSGTEYYYFMSNWDSTGRSMNVKNITGTTVTSKTISYTSAGICSDITTTTQYTFNPSNTGTTGQVLTKTASGYGYADAPVTSVNGNTGAVTGLQTTANLKTSLTDNSDSYYPSQKAVKTAVDTKQDTLTNQTAYTAKGTATKVPTITTNTLGQVTAITETDIAFPVTSVNGQTGAVTLSIPSITATTVTLTVVGWSSSTQTVNVTGVTASNHVIVAPDPSDLNDYAEKGIYCSGQGSGTLTFTCDTTPTASITVNVLIMNL